VEKGCVLTIQFEVKYKTCISNRIITKKNAAKPRIFKPRCKKRSKKEPNFCRKKLSPFSVKFIQFFIVKDRNKKISREKNLKTCRGTNLTLFGSFLDANFI